MLLKLWSLLRLGRQATIFVITATQRPDVNFIQGQPAKPLTAGDLAILEVDGGRFTVEITDVEDDPTYLAEEGELRELQIIYRIAAGHAASGELGMTTLVEDERS